MYETFADTIPRSYSAANLIISQSFLPKELKWQSNNNKEQGDTWMDLRITMKAFQQKVDNGKHRWNMKLCLYLTPLMFTR